MNEQDEGLQSRLVVDLKRDGRRKYDEDAKRELIQACLKPGVSIARTAMEHDINPNLVRTWISKYQREQAAGEIISSATESSRETRVELSTASVPEESAFMQAVTSAAAPTPAKSAAVSARRQLAGTSPHAFRHTFGTQSAAAGMAIEVLQQVLGHGSLQTTTIYVNAEQQRMRQESAKYHARLGARNLK